MSLWQSLFGSRGGAPRIDGAQARKLVADGALLLDVRSPREFAGGHLTGAMNIPVDQLAQHIDALPSGPIVIYCRSGMRSARAARQILAEGRTEVYDLGGMSAW